MMEHPKISIVILSYNRPESIYRNVREILEINFPKLEVIIVDNCSKIPVTEILYEFKDIRIIRLNENVGVAGRNKGILEAKSDYIVTLDDDVFGVTAESLSRIIQEFEDQPMLGAINFKVLDDVTENQINWCHHRKLDEWSDKSFQTYEISEGAVALRRSAVLRAGLYPEYFFISHEGPDLAIRMMDVGFDVIYLPDVTVRHAHAEEGRPSWRRYYYDSRNVIWLAFRNYPLGLACKRLFIDLSALLVYAVRDGFFLYWIKGILDAIKGLPKVIKDRSQISETTMKRYKELENKNPSFLYMVQKRVFQKGVNI